MAIRRSDLDDVDRQLIATRARRESALDRLTQAFIDICTADSRIDVLLDRRAVLKGIDPTDQMT
jgi:hypothetical protein